MRRRKHNQLSLWNRVDENDADGVTTSGRITSLGRPRRNVGTYEDGPARNRKFPIEGEEWYNCSLSNIHNKCREETLEQLLLKEKPKKPSPFSPPYINYSSSYLYQRRLYIYKLILAHHQSQFLPETLSLAVNLFDRFIITIRSSKNIITGDRQLDTKLYSLTCLLLASKLHENYDIISMQRQKDIADFMKDLICRKSTVYVEMDTIIVEMEYIILSQLNYYINVPTVYTFLHIYLEATGSQIINIERDASFLVDMTLASIYHLVNNERPSAIACGCLYIARKINGMIPWTKAFDKCTFYEGEHVKQIARYILSILSLVEQNDDLLRLSKDKYLKVNRSKISKLRNDFY